MPSAPDVAMTPAPKRFGKPCATIAGMMTEPIATTVAGDEPDTAANSAQATTPRERQGRHTNARPWRWRNGSCVARRRHG